MEQVTPNSVRGSLIPIQTHFGLLGRQNINKTATKWIEVISRLNVSMKRSSIELGQNENPIDVRIDAVADGDIDETIFASEGNSGFAAFLGEGMKSGATTAAHDHGKYSFCGEHRKGHGGLELASPLVGSIIFAKQK